MSAKPFQFLLAGIATIVCVSLCARFWAEHTEPTISASVVENRQDNPHERAKTEGQRPEITGKIVPPAQSTQEQESQPSQLAPQSSENGAQPETDNVSDNAPPVMRDEEGVAVPSAQEDAQTDTGEVKSPVLQESSQEAPQEAIEPAQREAAEQSAEDAVHDEPEARKLPPLESLVTSPFGLRNSQKFVRATRRRGHRGVDIKTRIGWPVVALGDGEVVQAGPGGAAGIMVKLKLHDGMTVAYAHLEKVLVEKGKTVAKGDVLGSTGCTGRTTGSHLHLAMRNANDELVDPLDYVKSADDILKPSPEQIPDEITSEACRRGFFLGRGRRVGGSGQGLGAMGNYQFPTIPVWPGK